MGAPEKLYINSKQRPDKEIFYGTCTKVEGDDIEYTRTNAFIEKACDAYCKVCGHYAHSVPTHICRHDCRYFSDFKKYIEGE